MSAPTPDSSRRPQYMWGAAIAITLLVLFVAFMRKDSGPAAPAGDAKDKRADAEAELQRQLRGTLDSLRPERLNVNVAIKGVVADLNLWWADYSAQSPPVEAAERAALIEKWLGAEAASIVSAGRFSERDAGHIRDARMYHDIATSLSAVRPDRRELAAAAFALVMRQISLASSSASQVPLGSFEVLMVGRGSVDDRIWVFAEILRQLGIDCVVLEPKTPPAGGGTAPKLVAAILPKDGVLLFDPRLGLAIPPTSDVKGALPSGVVTLQEARENDAIFRQFDVPGGSAYPWTSALLADAGVRFIIDGTYAAPRMLSLQTVLPAEHAATLYDGPALSAESASLADRVVAAGKDGGWTAESVSAWKYPEQRLSAFYAAGGEEAPEVQNLLATLHRPQGVQSKVVNGVEQYVPVDSSHPLRAVRVEHLRGKLDEALPSYNNIRTAPTVLQLQGVPITLDNALVREDGIHWVSVCQEELGRYDAAIENLKGLLKNYSIGVWSGPSRRALARCAALAGRYEEAISLLPAPGDNQPPDFADAYFRRRWEAQVPMPAAENPKVSE